MTISTESHELPEHRVFHILRKGESESIGPYSQKELLKLINENTICSHDWVYYSALKDWTPLSDVFEFHQSLTNFGNEGQDHEMVSAAYNFIEHRSEPDESIYYIAIQRFAATDLTATVRLRLPKAVVLTNTRFCVVFNKLMAETTFEDYPVEQIRSTGITVDPGKSTGIFEIHLRNGNTASVNLIPLAQLAKLEEVSEDLLSNRG